MKSIHTGVKSKHYKHFSKVSDLRQSQTSYILFIRIEQSIDLSVHSLRSLEGQRFCCLLGFFLRQLMKKYVIYILSGAE